MERSCTLVAVNLSDSDKFLSYFHNQEEQDSEAQLGQFMTFVRLIAGLEKRQQQAAQAEKAKLAQERAARFLNRRKDPPKVDDSHLVKEQEPQTEVDAKPTDAELKKKAE